MKKSIIILHLVLSVIFVLALSTCDKSSTKPDDESIFKGITETNVDGEILSVDPNDWCWDDPHYPGMIPQKYQIRPAFPNPTYNIPIIINFKLPKLTLLNLFIVNENMDTVVVLTSGLHQAGYFQFHWDLKDHLHNRLLPGTYRCYFDVQDTIITGDIKIEDYLTIVNSEYVNYADQHYDLDKWTNWYNALTSDEQHNINLFVEVPVTKNKTFYELIGKVSGFIVGWNDVPSDLSVEQVYGYESALKKEYIILWNSAHGD